MLETLKYYLKKYWILFPFILVISLPLLILCVIPTNKEIILKGDTTIFSDVIEVDTDYSQEGSFSTIYVSSMEHSTIFQNWVVSYMSTAEVYEMSSSQTHISTIEGWKAAKIQYRSSLGNSLVLAYAEAAKEDPSISLSYTFSGFEVTYYGKDSAFRIGDRIVKIFAEANDYKESTIADEMDFRHVINTSKKAGDVYTVIRDGVEKEIVLTEDDEFFAYSIYTVDGEASTPKYKQNDNNVGGPSGGLLQTLSIYNQLVEEDLTHGLKIAGTGTISYTGVVGTIGGIREKIPTALDDHIDVFFCAAGNYEAALDAYNSISGHERMKLIRIETFYDALDYLKEGYKNDFGN